MGNATSEIITVIDNAALELHYMCQTKHVSYSIADCDGYIVKRGSYDCIIDNKLPIADIPKGFYVLCIIDGDLLTKARFRKN
jgi:hypothetical protein